MAELLRDSVPKDENAGMGRMAAAPNPCIHLEAMEETPKVSVHVVCRSDCAE